MGQVFCVCCFVLKIVCDITCKCKKCKIVVEKRGLYTGTHWEQGDRVEHSQDAKGEADLGSGFLRNRSKPRAVSRIDADEQPEDVRNMDFHTTRHGGSSFLCLLLYSKDWLLPVNVKKM